MNLFELLYLQFAMNTGNPKTITIMKFDLSPLDLSNCASGVLTILTKCKIGIVMKCIGLLIVQTVLIVLVKSTCLNGSNLRDLIEIC